MNTNKEVTEVEHFCFRCGKLLARGNNSLTLRIAENLYEDSDEKMRRESLSVCFFVFVLILVLSQDQKRPKDFCCQTEETPQDDSFCPL